MNVIHGKIEGALHASEESFGDGRCDSLRAARVSIYVLSSRWDGEIKPEQSSLTSSFLPWYEMIFPPF